MSCEIINASKGVTLFSQAVVARSFWQRFKGLMLRRSMSEKEAVVFFNTNGLHTFFMLFDLDIIFLNKELKVIKVCKNVKPWRMVWCFNAYAAFEMKPFDISNRVALGDLIRVS